MDRRRIPDLTGIPRTWHTWHTTKQLKQVLCKPFKYLKIGEVTEHIMLSSCHVFYCLSVSSGRYMAFNYCSAKWVHMWLWKGLWAAVYRVNMPWYCHCYYEECDLLAWKGKISCFLCRTDLPSMDLLQKVRRLTEL